MLLVEIALVEAVEAVEREAVVREGEAEEVEVRAGVVEREGDALIAPLLRTETQPIALSLRSVQRAGTVIAGEAEEEAGVAQMAIAQSAMKVMSVAMALEGGKQMMSFSLPDNSLSRRYRADTRPRSAMALERPTGESKAMRPRLLLPMPPRQRVTKSRRSRRTPLLLSLPPLLSPRRSSSPLRSTRLPLLPRRLP